MGNERRQFLRYRMKESAFAVLNQPTTIVGKIKDMSLGGAAFEFITSSTEAEQELDRNLLDIFLLGGLAALSSLPCKIFFRKPAARIENSAHVFFPAFISRVCVAEFKDLNEQQESALLDFIMKFSAGYAI